MQKRPFGMRAENLSLEVPSVSHISSSHPENRVKIPRKHIGKTDLSSVQNPCWLMIMGDYITQYVGDFKNPIEESL